MASCIQSQSICMWYTFLFVSITLSTKYCFTSSNILLVKIKADFFLMNLLLPSHAYVVRQLKRSVDVFYNMVCVTLIMYLMRSSLRCYVISLGLASYLTIWSWNTSSSFVLQKHGYLCRAVPFSRKKNLKGSVIIEESVSSTFTNTFLLFMQLFFSDFCLDWLAQ